MRRSVCGTHEIVKFLPNNPPQRGQWPDGIVVVNDQRCRVVKCKVAWDGPHWTIKSLWVRPWLAPGDNPASATLHPSR